MRDHILDKALEDLAKVSHQPDVPKEQPVSKRSRSTTRQASAKKTKTCQDEYSPLVEHKLFYRVAVQSWQRQSPHVKAAEKVFVRVFHETWNYLPECDQHCLLSNWHDPASQSLGIDAAAQRHPRPLIQIVNIGEWDPTYYAVAKLGDQLNFPLSLITGHADRLPHEIARALAMVYRVATREHWDLVVSMLDEPMAQWEKSQRRISEDASKRKYKTLEKKYLKVFKEQVALKVREWGIEEPPSVGA